MTEAARPRFNTVRAALFVPGALMCLMAGSTTAIICLSGCACVAWLPTAGRWRECALVLAAAAATAGFFVAGLLAPVIMILLLLAWFDPGISSALAAKMAEKQAVPGEEGSQRGRHSRREGGRDRSFRNR